MAEMDRKASQLISRVEPAKPAAPVAFVGMILFLISEAFLFGSLFWAFYYLRAGTPVWPPEGVVLTTELAIINTAILLVSSVTFWLGTVAIRRKSQGGLAAGLLITLLLGAAFLTITGWEWVHETFRPWTHAYGSIFYTLTGFHSLHVLGGVIIILFLLIRTVRNRFTSTNYVPVEVGSLYWHFVDFIWLIVFSSIFIIR